MDTFLPLPLSFHRRVGLSWDVLASQFFVLFTGMAGRAGFIGMNGPEIKNRYSEFGHSGYFQDNAGTVSDEYMRVNWLPLLTSDAPIREFDSRKAPTAID